MKPNVKILITNIRNTVKKQAVLLQELEDLKSYKNKIQAVKQLYAKKSK